MNWNSKLVWVILLFGLTCCTRNSNEKILYGKWVCVEETPKEDKILISDGDSDAPDFSLIFEKDSVEIFYSINDRYKANYQLQDSVIQIGWKEFYIESLSQDTIILIEKPEQGMIKFAPTKRTYVKQ